MRFKRSKSTFFEQTKTYRYNLTAGTATVNIVETGTYCSFQIHQTFSMVGALPKNTVPLYLSYFRPLKSRRVGGSLPVDQPFTTTETCDYGDGDPPQLNERSIQPQLLMDLGYGKEPKNFKRFHGTHKESKITYTGDGTSATTWNWDLKSH
jgi:hypothetical protein